MSTVFDNSLIEKQVGNYVIGKTYSITDKAIVKVANDYKARLRKLIPITGDTLKGKLYKGETIVLKKRDGEFNFSDVEIGRSPESVFCNAPRSRGRYGLPVNDSIEKIVIDSNQNGAFDKIKKKVPKLKLGSKLTKIQIAGELWADVNKPGDRARVFDFLTISRSPKSNDDLKKIKYDVFDIVSINGESLLELPYKLRLEVAMILFPSSKKELVSVIPYQIVNQAQQVHDLYERWVEKENEEGIVIRSFAGFKVKPVRDMDVVIIGYSEMLDYENMVSSVLVALMRKDKTFQVIGSVGGGFSNEDRANLFQELKQIEVDSEYIHTTRDGLTYKMVKPEKIIEIEYMDAIIENAKQEPILRAKIKFETNEWKNVQVESFVSIISPRFKRYREDKKVSPDDLRLEQLGGSYKTLVANLADKLTKDHKHGKSRVLFKAIFTGKYKGAVTIQKYLLWKTNKTDDYPDYVVAQANYSFNRNDPLRTDVRPFNDLDKAIEEIQKIAENGNGVLSGTTGKLKRGWSLNSVEVEPEIQGKIDALKVAEFF